MRVIYETALLLLDIGSKANAKDKVLAYPGLRILVFETDVIPFLRGQNLARIEVEVAKSVWTSSASYMRQITLTLTSSMKIACLYISVDPTVTRMSPA